PPRPPPRPAPAPLGCPSSRHSRPLPLPWCQPCRPPLPPGLLLPTCRASGAWRRADPPFPPGRSGRGRQEPRWRSLPHALTASRDGGGAPIVAPGCQRTLGRVLALVSVPGSIHYTVLPRLHPDEILPMPPVLARAAGGPAAWC